MRNQYKILSEKYQALSENKGEDLFTGLQTFIDSVFIPGQLCTIKRNKFDNRVYYVVVKGEEEEYMPNHTNVNNPPYNVLILHDRQGNHITTNNTFIRKKELTPVKPDIVLTGEEIKELRDGVLPKKIQHLRSDIINNDIIDAKPTNNLKEDEGEELHAGLQKFADEEENVKRLMKSYVETYHAFIKCIKDLEKAADNESLSNKWYEIADIVYNQNVYLTDLPQEDREFFDACNNLDEETLDEYEFDPMSPKDYA